jgi:ppGpp synthetase/RelA/SpoT-type nucleotidyltranferase
MTTKLPDITFYYRIKSSEKLLKRMNTHDKKSSYRFIQNSCSDLFGCRLILTKVELEALLQKTHYFNPYESLIKVKKK